MCNLFIFCVWKQKNIGISDKNPGLVSLYLKLAVGLTEQLTVRYYDDTLQ